jgi:hypothetical protein
MFFSLLVLSLIPVTCVVMSVALMYPQPIYPDSDIAITIRVNNGGPKSMRVSKVLVKFDWAPELTYQTGETKIIPSGSQAEFSLRFHVPDGITTNIEHVFTITVYAADPTDGVWQGDVSAESKFNVPIAKRPPPRTEVIVETNVWTMTAKPPDIGFAFGILSLFIVALVLVGAYAVARVVVRQRGATGARARVSLV